MVGEADGVLCDKARIPDTADSRGPQVIDQTNPHQTTSAVAAGTHDDPTPDCARTQAQKPQIPQQGFQESHKPRKKKQKTSEVKGEGFVVDINRPFSVQGISGVSSQKFYLMSCTVERLLEACKVRGLQHDKVNKNALANRILDHDKARIINGSGEQPEEERAQTTKAAD